MKWSIVVLVVLALLSMPTSMTAQQQSSVFNFGAQVEPDSIDPHIATSADIVAIENAYEALVYPERDTTNIKPQLAESWTVSPDGVTYTFKIRRGVKFHDGTELDAEAVKESFERLLKINKGPVWVLANLQSIVVKDRFTVEMRVKPGGPPFLQALVPVKIVSPTFIKKFDRNGDLAQDVINRVSAGTGPYKIVSWQRRQRVEFRKFDDYWGGWDDSKHFTAFNMLTIPEPSTQQLMLEKGEIDMAFLWPADSLPALEKNPGIQVLRLPGFLPFAFRLQYAAPPTNDIRVRQALNYAWDFSSFRKVMQNTVDPPEGPVPPQYLGNWAPKSPFKFDLRKAKELLNAAGYNETNKAKLIADIQPGFDRDRRAAEILQAALRMTGAADLEINEVPIAARIKYNVDWARTKDPATAHHLFALVTPPRVLDPFSYLWFTYHSKSSGAFSRNMMNYANPAVDALIDRALSTVDPRTRTELYRQAAQRIVDDAADVFLGREKTIYVMRKNIKGFFSVQHFNPTVLVYFLSRD